jgi:hypothetical protein
MVITGYDDDPGNDAIGASEGNSPMPDQTPQGDRVWLVSRRKRWGAKRQTDDIGYDPEASRRWILFGGPYRSVEKLVEIPYKEESRHVMEPRDTKISHLKMGISDNKIKYHYRPQGR